MPYAPPTGHPLGLAIETATCTVIPRDRSYLRGEAVALDWAESVPETINSLFGDPGSHWVNVVRPTAADVNLGVCLLMLEDATQDKEARAMLYGEHEDALLLTAGPTPGTPYVPISSGSGQRLISLTGRDGERALAVSLDASRQEVVGGATLHRCRVAWNGAKGFGVFTS